jgi:hypothetical protein
MSTRRPIGLGVHDGHADDPVAERAAHRGRVTQLEAIEADDARLVHRWRAGWATGSPQPRRTGDQVTA